MLYLFILSREERMVIVYLKMKFEEKSKLAPASNTFHVLCVATKGKTQIKSEFDTAAERLVHFSIWWS